MSSFLEPLHSGVPCLILLSLSVLLLLLQLFVALSAMASRLERSAGSLARLCGGLCLAGPLLVSVLMAFGVQAGRNEMLSSLFQADSAMYVSSMARGISRAMNAWALGGLALLALSITGPVALAIVRWRERRGSDSADALMTAALGLSLCSGLLGAMIFYRTSEMVTGFQALAGASAVSRAQFLAMALGELPDLSWLVYALHGLVGLTLILLTGQLLKRSPAVGKGVSLTAGLSLFVLGALAFLGTRGHAGDRLGVLPGLLGHLSADGHDYRILVRDDLDLPDLSSATPMKPGPLLQVDRKGMVLDGKPLRGQELTFGTDPLTSELAGRLKKLREQHAQIHPGQSMADQLILQADGSAPQALLARLFRGCRQGGVHKIQLATLHSEKIQSEVFGPLELVGHRALTLDLVDPGTPGALQFSEGDLGSLAVRLDAAAQKGRVQLVVPANSMPPAIERAPSSGLE